MDDGPVLVPDHAQRRDSFFAAGGMSRAETSSEDANEGIFPGTLQFLRLKGIWGGGVNGADGASL